MTPQARPQASLSMGFSRQEYWSRLPFSPPRDLPDTEIEPAFPVSPALQAGSLLLEPGEVQMYIQGLISFRIEWFHQNSAPSVLFLLEFAIRWRE